MVLWLCTDVLVVGISLSSCPWVCQWSLSACVLGWVSFRVLHCVVPLIATFIAWCKPSHQAQLWLNCKLSAIPGSGSARQTQHLPHRLHHLYPLHLYRHPQAQLLLLPVALPACACTWSNSSSSAATAAAAQASAEYSHACVHGWPGAACNRCWQQSSKRETATRNTPQGAAAVPSDAILGSTACAVANSMLLPVRQHALSCCLAAATSFPKG